MTTTSPLLPAPGRHNPDRLARDRDLRSLHRMRWAVRAVLMLGVAASIAANVLHAHPNLISQLIAAWPPLALLLTVELISRVPADRHTLAAVRLIAAGTIAGIAGWVSYWHMVGVAARYGETSAAAAYLLPLSVDGLVVVASISLLEIAGRISRPIPPPHPGNSKQSPSPADHHQHPPVDTPTAPVAQQGIMPGNTAALTPQAEGVIAGVGDHPPSMGRLGIAAVDVAEPGARGNPAPPEAANLPGPTRALYLRQRQQDHGGDHAQHAATDADDHVAALLLGADRSEPPADGKNHSASPARDGEPKLENRIPADDNSTPACRPTIAPNAAKLRPPPSSGDRQGPGQLISDTANLTAAADGAAGDGDHAGNVDKSAVPSDTATAVAHWYRLDPTLHPADIAARIGKSERTVRRYWPPTTLLAVNQTHGIGEQRH